MSRRKQSEFQVSPQCEAAIERVTELARHLAADLAGDPPGRPQSPPAAALAMAMVAFLMRLDPRDLEALFFAEGSLAAEPFRPWPAGGAKDAPLEPLLFAPPEPVEAARTPGAAGTSGAAGPPSPRRAAGPATRRGRSVRADGPSAT